MSISGTIGLVDSTWYEEAAGRLRGLLIRLDDRLPGDQQREVAEFIDVNEHGRALETLADFLCDDQLRVSADERSDMLALASRMRLDGRVGRALAFCPNVAE